MALNEGQIANLEHESFEVRDIKAQIARGDLDSAESLCRQALENQPEDHSARFLLAFILWRGGRTEPALDFCRQILAEEPDDAGLLSDLGNLLRELGADTDALEALDRSLRLRPGHSGAFYNRALVLDKLGREEEALDQIESIGPEDALFAKARYLRGMIRQDLGDMSGAEADFLDCIQAEPGHAAAWHLLVSTRRFKRGELVFDRLRERLAQSSGDNAARQRYLFALAKIHDDIGDYEAASDYLLEANRLVDARYDRQAIEKRLKSLHEYFPSIGFHSANRSEGSNPVFIVGLPRSGTTLVESLLARHPEISAMGELKALPMLIPDFSRLPGADEMEELGKRYLESLPAEARQSPLFLDKMPENFWRLGHIAAMFPAAKIVHCRRDVRDVALSNFFNLYSTGNNFSYSLADLAHYTACHQAIMRHWCSVMPSRILQADYDKVVTHPRKSTFGILAFLGRDAGKLPSIEEQPDLRRIRTASNWQVRQEIYTTSVDRWKNYPRLAKEFMSRYSECTESIEQLLA